MLLWSVGNMGALTDLFDEYVAKTAYNEAYAAYRSQEDYTRKKFCRVITERYLANGPLIASEGWVWYQRFMGQRAPQKIPLEKAKFFDTGMLGAEQFFKKICEKNGLEFYYRKSKDSDFFMFKPVEPVDMIILINKGNYSPPELNKIFKPFLDRLGESYYFRW